MITRVLINHSDTYYFRVRHNCTQAKWRIRLGVRLRADADSKNSGEVWIRIPRRHVVAIVEEP